MSFLVDAQILREAQMGWNHWFARYPADLALAKKNGWQILYGDKALSELYMPNSNPIGVFIWIQYQLKAAKKANYARSALPSV